MFKISDKVILRINPKTGLTYIEENNIKSPDITEEHLSIILKSSYGIIDSLNLVDKICEISWYNNLGNLEISGKATSTFFYTVGGFEREIELCKIYYIDDIINNLDKLEKKYE